MKSAVAQEKRRGRPEGSKNRHRELPATIHPDQRLTVAEMAALSGKSKSFFLTNLSLARTGRKHTTMPPVSKIGRHLLCRAADFFQWLEGKQLDVA
ncbi:hypothetical protein GMLC_22730 [Geomonas limicola]|uniref:Helix-turn-helix domain-containing protein n=1 Tax=Geomonas limicola TaxID=2740186 RepID=A0A6V8N9X7_9BACT|nr:hypothetical protein GMLC_22730 [Geomonas limicola]